MWKIRVILDIVSVVIRPKRVELIHSGCEEGIWGLGCFSLAMSALAALSGQSFCDSLAVFQYKQLLSVFFFSA